MMFVFVILSLILIVTAMGVLCFYNPIYSALCLIANLLTVAAFFAMLDAHFLATVQVVVYAGAIMVLVMFLLMLLNFKLEKPKTMGIFLLVLSGITGFAFLYLVIPIINDSFKVFPDVDKNVVGTVRSMGELLYTKYVFPFEAASILILAAMVGAVMIGKRYYRSK